MLQLIRPFAVSAGLVAVLFAAGCAENEVTPADPALLLSERPLPNREASTGIAVDDDGTIFVLTRGGALLQERNGSWFTRYQAAFPLEYEDIVALGEGRFALTATNMGFELDLGTGVLSQHFCYLPAPGIRWEEPPDGGQPTIEVAKAVTYDPVSGLIYAQPQTVQTDGTPTFSEIASFDRVTGSELVFRNLNARTFSAGGMAVLRRDGVGTRLIAAQRNVLHTIDFETGARRAALDLSSLGIEDVVGMASDPAAGVLHVLDQRGETPFHVTLDLDALRAEL